MVCNSRNSFVRELHATLWTVVGGGCCTAHHLFNNRQTFCQFSLKTKWQEGNQSKKATRFADFRKQEQTTFSAEVTRILSTERFSSMAIRGAVSWSISTFVECRQTLMQYSDREYLPFFLFFTIEKVSTLAGRKRKRKVVGRSIAGTFAKTFWHFFFILFGG